MIELVIAPQEAGRKLGRLMEHLMPAVPKSFLYKAIRQNKIKIDRKKPADLSVVLQAGNVVQIYLTDEQLKEFGYRAGNVQKQKAETGRGEKKEPLRVLYEDDQLLIVFKPAGIATQKGKNDPWSFTDAALEYLHAKGEGMFGTYRPSFCHRLDKNTAGALIMAKTLEAHHRVDELLSSRKIHKYYLAVTESEAPEWQEETTLVNGYRKDHVKNMAEIVPFQEPLPDCREHQGHALPLLGTHSQMHYSSLLSSKYLFKYHFAFSISLFCPLDSLLHMYLNALSLQKELTSSTPKAASIASMHSMLCEGSKD